MSNAQRDHYRKPDLPKVERQAMTQTYKEQVEAIHAGLMTTDMNGSPSELYIARWQAEDIAAQADAALSAAREERDALRAAMEEFLETQDALDNHELMGPNAEDYFVLLRRRNAARKDLDAAIASA